jgi:hypothetical protein
MTRPQLPALSTAQAYWNLIHGAKKWLAIVLGLFFRS